MIKNETNVVKRIEAILEQEQQMLRNGDFSKFESFVAEKQNAFDALKNTTARISPEAARNLEKILARNRTLYEAAMEGMKAGSARISEIRQTIGGLKTYDNSGKIKSRKLSSPSISLKA